MAYTTIDDPSAYFQTLLYTGDGNDDRNLVNTGNSDLQPDWIWNKRRDSTSNHFIFDSSRGASKIVVTDTTEAEGTNTNQLQAFQTDGFQLGSDNGSNGSSRTMVAWQWKANGGTRTTFTESGDNPGGGRQVSTTAGFGIYDYTGTGGAGTIAHGLGATPKVVIIKGRTNTEHWIVATTQLDGSRDGLYLETTGAKFDLSSSNELIFDSTNITVSDNWVDTNADGQTYIMYAFAPIKGYSRFGMYRGNGSADGTFVYTGFKPAWLMFKRTDATASWGIVDNRRNKNDTQDIGNVIDAYLNPDLDNDDSGNSATTDFLSNGFKHRRSGNFINDSGATYIYMAFAESPFTSSEGVPTTAR